MFRKSFIKKFILGFVALVFVSCDKDFNTIDANIIGENNYNLKSFRSKNVIAYNQGLGVMQSNNLPVNPLGVYQDPNFHTTTAHFVTQLQLSSANLNPTFGASLKVEKVELVVPYFFDPRKKVTASDGTSTYVLESIYGTPESKMKLSVFENGYFLRDTNPASGFTEGQTFFADQRPDFDLNRYGTDADGNSVLFGSRLNDSTAVNQNDAFFFDKSEIKEITVDDDGDTTTTYLPPALKLNLNKEYFENKIVSDVGKANMVNNNVFKNYFRGLYFKIEKIPGENGALALMDFTKGKVTITYTEDGVVSGETTRIEKTIELNMSGNTVSLQDISNVNMEYSDALSNVNAATGDEKLYLKGGLGSMTVIDLFGNSGQLDSLRTLNWRINEASLTFYIDRDELGLTVVEPNRVYLYDLNNNRPLLDYFTDVTTNTTAPKNGKFVHDGIIQKLPTDESNRGDRYRIRITNHVANLIRNDSTNVRLGLVVTEDYRIVSNMDRKNPGSSTIKKAPMASVMNPLGTILHGTAPAVPADKRIKFEIFYTEIN
ncbi:DUF4270 domain-containing protein [Flavobacterium sp.]|jgi:hypothetical protein|uniref:DUF4270 domain-containing protein n=1 Tax=Flavobacterium sp. TaxID=239 RepID=UPI0037C13040